MLTTFCLLHKVSENGKILPLLLSSQNLDVQTFFFKVTMLHNVEVVLKEDNHLNLISCGTPPNSLKNSNVSSKVEIMKEK